MPNAFFLKIKLKIMKHWLKVNNQYINLEKLDSIKENDSSLSIIFIYPTRKTPIKFPNEETYDKAKQKLYKKFNPE